MRWQKGKRCGKKVGLIGFFWIVIDEEGEYEDGEAGDFGFV